MQKIMFNTPYFMHYAVMQGWKEMTRRPVGDRMTKWDIKAYLSGHKEVAHNLAPYKIGETVAIAQAYKDVLDELPDRYREMVIGLYSNSKAWTNKLYVRPDLMPHQIQITDIKVERLQDISPEDCLKEGIQSDIGPVYWISSDHDLPGWKKANDKLSEWLPGRNGKPESYFWNDPQRCFANLIDVISGKGTWDRNDWQFAYTFKLVK